VTAPAISVVVPVHDAQAHLVVLLDSLRAQSEPSIEIIAIDDGSGDGSLAILQKAAREDPRVVVLSQPNRGVAAARNLGLAHARGPWIAFADSDDWLDPRALAAWRAQAERDQLDLLLGNGYEFTGTPGGVPDAPSILVRQGPTPAVFSGVDWIKHGVAHAEWRHFVWLQLVRRDLVESQRLRFDEGIVHEDVLWSMRLGLLAQRVGFCDRPFYAYRAHQESITRSATANALHDRARSYLAVISQLADAAEKQQDIQLRRALRRHAQREGRNFFALMREGVLDPAVRPDLARKFLDLGLLRVMFGGADDPKTLWRAIRCWGRLRRCAARPPGRS
jgi:glycosyltransferase involved in cell wall biosynthesis